MERYLRPYIARDLQRKIVLLTGPRQAGKTTLARMMTPAHDYLNFDDPGHRVQIRERAWDRAKELVILDELHKMRNWKSWLKGVYDTESIPPGLLVTGSAKLDTYRRVGDSLAGRFFQFRLHPLDVKEVQALAPLASPDAALDRLLVTGGFPEPFLAADPAYYRRWKRTHLDIILRQDLIDLESIRHITLMETLIQLLRRRVGSPVSFHGLARDLEVSDKTVKRWLTILEDMYVVFRVPPYHHNVARSLLKAPKFYFYDTGQVVGDAGARLENAVACALLKEIHCREDCDGDSLALYYLRTKDGREIDFAVVNDDGPTLLLEVKWADSRPTPHFTAFGKWFPDARKVQLVKDLRREQTFPTGVEVRVAASWLAACSW